MADKARFPLVCNHGLYTHFSGNEIRILFIMTGIYIYWSLKINVIQKIAKITILKTLLYDLKIYC